MLKAFFSGILQGIIRSFAGKNILWHVLAAGITYILVVSGFDWQYRVITRGNWANVLGLFAGLTGFLVPIILPLGIFLFGTIKHQVKWQSFAMKLFQVVVITVIIIASYKAITGRDHPGRARTFSNTVIEAVDNSHNFKFGFWRESIFYGWPSSHTGVAFAMSSLTALQFKSQKWVGIGAFFYACIIGLGASVSFHWLSDVIAGVIIGSLIGYVVYQQKIHN